jgi:eukaryotic-like serine/threonine-protein kinase
MQKKINNFEIVEKLNAGGTAVIYAGIDLNRGERVAIKELNPAFFSNQMMLQNFRREANRYLELTHPNIVRLKDFILLPTTGYLVMEFLDGKNLREYISEISGPLPLSNVSLFMMETMAALGFAHDQDVVHLDIKPSNIMLTNNNEIKLIDFGISSEGTKNAGDAIMGSPYYMSPEQINGSDIDYRTDIYSIGITIYELLTGKLPFDGDLSREELFELIRNKKIPNYVSPNQIDKAHEKEMNRILQKATSKSPNDRYQSCEKFTEDLLQFLN